jgi:hypothetical protein
MKIMTALSMMQLKNQAGTFLTYLKRKGVHINYAPLGMVETVTLGWIGQSHPSFGYRDETKEQISKLMKSEYPNMQYALFPRAFHYVTDKNVKMTTRGIALQIMKHDNVPVAKFREELVRKWQNLDKESGNPLGTQYLVHVDVVQTSEVKLCGTSSFDIISSYEIPKCSLSTTSTIWMKSFLWTLMNMLILIQNI